MKFIQPAKMDRELQLNDDVCMRVLSHLEAEDVAHVGATCRFWRDAATNPHLWQRLLAPPLDFADTRAGFVPDRSAFAHFQVHSAWTAAAATERKVRTPFSPAVVAIAPCDGDTYALAVAGGPEHPPSSQTWRTPVTVYSPHVGTLRPIAFASVQHHVGAKPVCMKMHSCPSQFLLAYAYSDGTVALYSLPTEVPTTSAGNLCEASLLWRSATLLGDKVTAIDVNDRQVLVGTMNGGVVVVTSSAEATRYQLGRSGIFAVCAGREVGCGLAGSANGEVFAFDMNRRGDTLMRYVGPSGHPTGSVVYGASGGLVVATYLQTTQHSLPPVATAWDSRTGRRVGSFAATRMRRRRSSAPRGVSVGAPDSTGCDSKIGVLVGGAVLVYDVRRMHEALVEAGDDAVSVAMSGDRLVLGESEVMHGSRPSEHSVRCLDFCEAARKPTQEVSRFSPVSVASESPWRRRKRVPQAPTATEARHLAPCTIRT